MSHEPECMLQGKPSVGNTCPDCKALRAAHRRGREDAANAIVAQVDEWLHNGLYGTPAFQVVWLDYANKLVLAARGDGDRA